MLRCIEATTILIMDRYNNYHARDLLFVTVAGT
jgi:hypothetical protein